MDRTSTFSSSKSIPPTLTRGMSFSRPAAAGLAAALCVCGLTMIWSTVVVLWQMWTTDALKSIGMIVPLVSLVLVLRAWRGLGWEIEGSWWGCGGAAGDGAPGAASGSVCH